MSNRTIKYTDGEIARVIEDFLPADLVPHEGNVKVTLALLRHGLDSIKREVKKRRVPYQRMVRALLDTYAERRACGKNCGGQSRDRAVPTRTVDKRYNGTNRVGREADVGTFRFADPTLVTLSGLKSILILAYRYHRSCQAGCMDGVEPLRPASDAVAGSPRHRSGALHRSASMTDPAERQN